MNKSFAPSFQHFQKDIERQLKSEGKCEKNEYGQSVFRGYQAAVEQMFRTYMAKKAFAPLVVEFRRWNWEWGYNDYLLELSAQLQAAGDWPLIKQLWAAVVSKRRTNYNKTKKARKQVPDKVPEELVTKTRKLLADSLNQLLSYATAFQRETEVANYQLMIAKVEQRKNA
jgi:hypothetical protein